jgi:hypothetical protein
MSDAPKLPDFDEFSRWLASRLNRQAIRPERHDRLYSAAREARDEFVQARREAPARPEIAVDGRSLEVLQLLAAADGDTSLPPEIATPRGFRVTFAGDDGSGVEPSLYVLVTCPSELAAAIVGQTVYLWSGRERFEIGQFDAEGKAIGALPAGVEITAADFASGRVKLEGPLAPDSE